MKQELVTERLDGVDKIEDEPMAGYSRYGAACHGDEAAIRAPAGSKSWRQAVSIEN
jgi:hypothetical protein